MTGPRDSGTVHRAATVPHMGPQEISTPAPEDPWFARLRAGDPAALDRLARDEAPRVARLLTSMLGPRADLEDLTQAVFLEACRSMPRFRGDGSITSFVLGIAVRVARRTMRPSAWV